MSCVTNGSDINQTFIIESLPSTVSACTGIYTNVIVSCSGDTSISLDTGVIIFDGSLYTNQDITANTINGNFYFSGGTELETIINFKAISGGTFDSSLGNLSLITYDNTEILVTGFTDFYTTAATLVGSTVYFDRNDVLSAYTLDLSSLDINDTFVTGGTPDNLTHTYTFTNNSGGTFTVSGLTDIYITGGTFDKNTKDLSYTRVDDVSIDVNLPFRLFFESSADTIGNVFTTIDTITGITDNSNCYILSYVTAFKDNIDYGFWKRTLALNKVGNILQIIGENSDFDRISSGLTPNNLVYTVNGGDLEIKISGETAKNYSWTSNWEIIK